MNKKETRVLIAVYGSLRGGLHNHPIIENSKYIGTFSSEPVFSMYDLGSFPAIVNEGNFPIEFEVYAVNEEEAKSVDSLEGYNGENNKDSWYKKAVIATPFGKAYYYYFDKETNEKMNEKDLVESGNWKDHVTTKVTS